MVREWRAGWDILHSISIRPEVEEDEIAIHADVADGDGKSFRFLRDDEF